MKDVLLLLHKILGELQSSYKWKKNPASKRVGANFLKLQLKSLEKLSVDKKTQNIWKRCWRKTVWKHMGGGKEIQA